VRYPDRVQLPLAKYRVSAAAQRRWEIDMVRCRAHPRPFIEYVFDIVIDDVQAEWIEMWIREPASVLHGAVGLGKSMLARGFVLWLLGRNAAEQVIWLGATQRQPKKALRSIAGLIERYGSKSRLHHVFPALRPGTMWRSIEIEIERDVDPADADPTIQVYGAFSDSILGARGTVLVIDDICNFSNTLTADGREKMIEWLGSVITRLVKLDVKLIVLGNVWHNLDATMDLIRSKGFFPMRTPAYVVDAETGDRIPTAPRAMSLAKIEALERRLSPVQAERMLGCKISHSELGRFRAEWFAVALQLGRGLPFSPARMIGACYTGIDLGHTKKIGSDYTSIVTIIVLVDGRRQIVDIRTGRWVGLELVNQIRDVKRRYGSLIGIESNGGQQLLIDLAEDLTAIPLTGKHTGVNKYDSAAGIENLAHEVQRGFWIFPSPKDPVLDAHGLLEDEDDAPADYVSAWTIGGTSPHPEIQALIYDALAYDPDKHPGDRLMAWWIASRTAADSVVGGLMSADEFAMLDLHSR
jgi:hypothetical protein